MTLPSTYTTVNETGCCPIPDLAAWDRTVVPFDDVHAIRMRTRNVLHIPVNMAHVMRSLHATAEHAGADMDATHGMVLTRDLSAWSAEHLYVVARPVEGADNVTLSGDFASLAFEGPYRDAPRWTSEVSAYARSRDRDPQETYLFYTTCPACAKHYGTNYVIALTRLGSAPTRVDQT